MPVYCGEWGVMTKAPGYLHWVRDVAAILEEHGYSWSLWAWVGRAQQDNTTFDVSLHKPVFYRLMSEILSHANHSGGSQMTAAKDEE